METIDAIDRLISDTAFASAKRRKAFKEAQKKEKNAEFLQKKEAILENLAAEEAAEKAVKKLVGYGKPFEINTGAMIVYTSADSVLQICGNEETFDLDNLYRCCEISRQSFRAR